MLHMASSTTTIPPAAVSVFRSASACATPSTVAIFCVLLISLVFLVETLESRFDHLTVGIPLGFRIVLVFIDVVQMSFLAFRCRLSWTHGISKEKKQTRIRASKKKAKTNRREKEETHTFTFPREHNGQCESVNELLPDCLPTHRTFSFLLDHSSSP